MRRHPLGGQYVPVESEGDLGFQVLAQSLNHIINFPEPQFLHLSVGRKSILSLQDC